MDLLYEQKKKLTYSFDIDFEGIESVLHSRLNVTFEELDALLLEEVLDSWLSNSAIVCDAISFNSTSHVLQVVVGAEDGTLRQISDTVNEVLVTSI